MKAKPDVKKRDLSGYRLDDQIGYLLRRAYQRACTNTSRMMEEYGITPLQYATLARLQECSEVSQNRLGRLVDMEPGNFHGVIRRLIDRGLVTRRQDDGDRRKVSLKLTPCGRELAEKLVPLSVKRTEITLAGLTAVQRNQLRQFLEFIVRSGGEDGQ